MVYIIHKNQKLGQKNKQSFSLKGGAGAPLPRIIYIFSLTHENRCLALYINIIILYFALYYILQNLLYIMYYEKLVFFQK